MRLESQAISYKQIEEMLEKVKMKSSRNATLRRLQDYLEYFLLILRVLGELRASGIDEFEDVIDSDSFSDIQNQEDVSFSDGELVEFIDEIRQKSLHSSEVFANEGRQSKEYLVLLREYFSAIKTEFNPIFSQDAANQLLVVHSVFLNGSITQQEIEDMTSLPRSTISEILKQSVNSRIIKFTKNEGSRIKFYKPAISFTDIMLGNFDQLAAHLSKVIPRLIEYRNQVKKIPNSLNQKNPFLRALRGLEEAYAFTRYFSRKMNAELLIRLKKEIDSGHPFI
jgi:hypothetical protein